jgi:uncharacterized membrane-anchored protein
MAGERWPQPLAVKVPQIGVMFWVVKILTTGMGEAASDFLGKISIVLAGGVGVLAFGLAMVLQFRARRYVAWIYWFAVAMVAVFGTMVADGLHVVVGIPYPVTTICYAVAVAVIFWAWHRSEGTVSIHSIDTRRREVFYWLTVLATFALGTAAGDLTAFTLHLGYFSSAIGFAVVMIGPALGWWRLRLNPVVAFWIAYVITRPLGASLADWVGKPHSKAGGLDVGDGVVTVVAALAIAIVVAYWSVTKRDIQDRAPERAGPRSLVRWEGSLAEES